MIFDEDVVLSLKLGAVGIDQVDGFDVVGGKLQVASREDTKRVLKSIYNDLKREFSITTEIVSGYDLALLGNWAVPSTKENTEALSVPVMIHMAFDDEGKVEKITIAHVDLQPLTEAIRAAVQTAARETP